jgi:hypothetical protein
VIVFGPPKVVVKAHGQFCRVEVVVKNKNAVARRAPAQDQFLFAGGQRYSAIHRAALQRHNRVPFFKDITAGSRARAFLWFDVPKGVEPQNVEFHASVSSPGTKVPLVLKQ